MSKLAWDETGERIFETGIDRGVLFPMDDTGLYDDGVVWNGLISVEETREGGEANPQYADNIEYVNILSLEKFGATVEAFTYPEEFEACDGTALVNGVAVSQQMRKRFGMAYRTRVGNDVAGDRFGEKIHLIWNALAKPASKSYATVNDSPEPSTFSWEITTSAIPVEWPGLDATSHLVIDSTKVPPAKFKSLTDLIWGTEAAESSLPTPDEVLELFQTAP